MLCKDQFGNEIFLERFSTAIRVPSGHVGINFGDTADFNLNTLILDMTFEDFLLRWKR